MPVATETIRETLPFAAQWGILGVIAALAVCANVWLVARAFRRETEFTLQLGARDATARAELAAEVAKREALHTDRLDESKAMTEQGIANARATEKMLEVIERLSDPDLHAPPQPRSRSRS